MTSLSQLTNLVSLVQYIEVLKFIYNFIYYFCKVKEVWGSYSD